MDQKITQNGRPIIYVTRDAERAMGLIPGISYHIVTNRSSYSESVKRQFPDFVHLVDSENKILSTVELLRQNLLPKLLGDTAGVIVVFKNTAAIETITKDKGWILLNPAAALAEKIENKISQVDWLGPLAQKYLPPTVVNKVSELKWKGEPIVIQWAHGHTGESTLLVEQEDQLKNINDRFPERIARVTRFLDGPSFTANAVVAKNKILAGNVSYQITGLAPFTLNRFATVGNDWGITVVLLEKSDFAFIDEMIRSIGNRLREAGWRGLFGLDFIKDKESARIFLVEINARQPASTTLESLFQAESRRNGLAGSTVFEAHIKTLRGEIVELPLIKIDDGAQIIQRVIKEKHGISEEIIGSLELAGYKAILYPNTAESTDLLRIQSGRGIMETHNKLNGKGKEIVAALQS